MRGEEVRVIHPEPVLDHAVLDERLAGHHGIEQGPSSSSVTPSALSGFHVAVLCDAIHV
jgi:hypothetical protein